MSLAFCYQQPSVTANFKSVMSDFQVIEHLPYELTGEGEHLYIRVRKTGCNTLFVVRQLAKYFGVPERQVSYAGLKDRFSVSEQWFSVHLPGKNITIGHDVEITGIEIIQQQRHNKKLQNGALSGNAFVITLRDVSDLTTLTQRWHRIVQQGVPNYFGEQRFGIEQQNIAQAKLMFQGKRIRDRKLRGLYLSAARSLIFNQIVSERINRQMFHHLIAGDVCMLAGSQSIFDSEHLDDDLIRRHQQGDIDITAPLWGCGELRTQGVIRELEQHVADQYSALCEGLMNAGLKQERRRIRLLPQQATLKTAENIAYLSFFLPKGCYATTVLRELVDYTDRSQQQKNDDHV
jgi:tRNA pseudouridine13 synthase